MSTRHFHSRGGRSSSGGSKQPSIDDGQLSDGVESVSANRLVFLVDLGFIGLICLLPFVMGGRQALGQVLLVALAAYTACAWSLSQFLGPRGDWVRSRMYFFPLAAIALVGFQIVHLPESILNRLSPQIAQVLPLWSGSTDQPGYLGTWSQISLTPHATLGGLIILSAYVLIFVVAMQRIRRVDDAQKFLRWMALAAVAMAAFGLLQFAFSNGKFFWFYQHPYAGVRDGVKGSFTNRNHLAHFMALGIAPLICWCYNLARRSTSSASVGFQSHREKVSLPLLCGLIPGAGLILLACVLSLSRGGMITMLVAVSIMLAIMVRARLLNGILFVGMGGLALCLAVGIAMFGEEMIQDRVDDVVSGEMNRLDQKNRRQDIWQANASAIRDYPLFGAGIGSHREVYPTYMEKVHLVEFSHAENGYLQVTLESGFIGIALLLGGWGLCLWNVARGLRLSSSPKLTLSLAVALAGLCASLVHSLVDFVWYVPSCVIPVIVLAACGLRLSSIARANAERTPTPVVSYSGVPRIFWGAATPAAALLGIWMTMQLLPQLAAEPHWHEYLRLTLNEEDKGNGIDQPLDADSAAENIAVEATADTTSSSSPSDEKLERFKQKLAALNRAVKADPADGRIRLRTAMAYFTVFHIMQQKAENRMSLNQIADAARSSPFSSREEMLEWVDRVIGKSRKYLDGALANTREGLKLSPLQGHGYLYLAELGFLDQDSLEAQEAYIRQALTTRPYDPQILFAAGREAFLHGDVESALAHWKGSFHRSPVYQVRIIDLMADIVPAAYFTENFDPNVKTLEILLRRYQNSSRPDDLPILLTALATTAMAEAETADVDDAVHLLLMSHRAYDQLNRPQDAWQALSAALELDDSSYEVHYNAGIWCFRQNRFSEAADHLEWCYDHKSDNRKLLQLAEKARARSGTAPSVRQASHMENDLE